MKDIVLRDAVHGDFDAICALNLAEVQHTSAMDVDRLMALHELSCFHRVACVDGIVAAFLLAMRDGAPYANTNFEWFARKFARFVYIDRVVVADSARGLGLGTRLYEELFAFARAHEIPHVTCEYNLVPANEPSRRFHDKLGFAERGTQWMADGTKKVSLQAAQIDER